MEEGKRKSPYIIWVSSFILCFSGFRKATLFVLGLYFHLVETMCSYHHRATSAVIVNPRSVCPWSKAVGTDGTVCTGWACPHYCTDQVWAPEQRSAYQSHPPGSGSCDRKLISHCWTVPGNAGAIGGIVYLLHQRKLLCEQQENGGQKVLLESYWPLSSGF